MTAVRAVSAALLSFWIGACAQEQTASSCTVRESADSVTVACDDGTSSTIPRTLPDGGAATACAVAREASSVVVSCADGSRLTIPVSNLGGLDGGSASCAVTRLEDGALSIRCPDGTHSTVPASQLDPLGALSLVGASRASCGACHDATEARAHISIMTVDSDSGPVETCGTCHGETGIAPVSKLHARPEFAAPGLRVQLLAASVDPSTRKPSLRVQISDSAGSLLSRDGVSMNFVLSRVEPATPASGGPQIAGAYRNYLSRSVTQQDSPWFPLAGGTPRSVQQPSAESAMSGSFSQVSEGVYDYTFAYTLPADYDPAATHVVGLYATRTVSGVRFVGNAERWFVPNDPSATPLMRNVVRTETCNGCHNPLAAHGGARQDVQLCLNCHSQGAVDPESGNVIDFKVMLHRIHMGKRLASVAAGTPYRIVGNGLSLHDWSQVSFPRPIENCQTCHTEEDGDRWIKNGVREACTACHEDVERPLAEGGHPIALAPDSSCGSADCHAPGGGAQDALSAHLTPLNTPTQPVFTLELVSASVESADQAPRVRLRALVGTLATGAVNPLMSTASFSMLEVFLNGPNGGFLLDAQTVVRVAKAELVTLEPADVPGEFTFALPRTLRQLLGSAGDPDSDSYTLSLRAQYDPSPGALPDDDRVDMLRNPAAPLSVNPRPSARETIAQTEKCNRCHGALSAHSGVERATSVEQCAMCHSATLDTRVRQGASGIAGPTTSLRLSTMVHRIHGGALAALPYRVFGPSTSAPYPLRDLSEIAFPGDVRDCSTCHAPGTYALPLPAEAPPSRTVVLP